jgi:6-phosphogluconolactonase
MGKLNGVALFGLTVILCWGCGGGSGGSTGGGGGTPPPPPPANTTFVYVDSGDQAGRVSGFSLDLTSGTLTPLVTLNNVGAAPHFMAKTPDGLSIFVPNFTGGTINTLTVHTFGDLTSDAITPGLANPLQTLVHPNGTIVYALQNGGGIQVYRLANFAPMALLSTANTPAGTPSRMAFSPFGNFLYLGIVGSGANPSGVKAYSANAATGALTPIHFTTTAAGPANLAVSLNNNLLISVEAAAPVSQVNVYSIQGDGSVGGVAGSSNAGSQASSVALNPAGTFLFVGNNADGTVSAYALAAGGALTGVTGSPFASGNGTSDLQVDPSGTFLAVSDTFAGDMKIFRIGANGALTATSTATISDGPVSVQIVHK